MYKMARSEENQLCDLLALVLRQQREKQLVEAEGWSDDGTYSHVDVNAVDQHRFPSLGRVPWWSANMEAGDCLYIPPR